MPPTVPCPPSKPISSRLPNAGGTPKKRAKRNPASPSPTTYCPQAINCPTVSCGNAKRTMSPSFGTAAPRKIVAKMTLMRKPGHFAIDARRSGGRRWPQVEKTSSPTAPPMTDEGR